MLEIEIVGDRILCDGQHVATLNEQAMPSRLDWFVQWVRDQLDKDDQ